MSRTFMDANLLVWEAYPTGGDHGSAGDPHIVFNCLTNPALRARVVKAGTDSADAEALIREGSAAQILDLWQRATPID